MENTEKVKAPNGCREYLTPNKIYPIVKKASISFTIIDDEGDIIVCLYKNDLHLNSQDWIIVKD